MSRVGTTWSSVADAWSMLASAWSAVASARSRVASVWYRVGSAWWRVAALVGVVLALGAPRPVAAAGRTAVVFVGGFASNHESTVVSFGPLAADLEARGWSPADVYYFSYDPASLEYADWQTCQPLGTTVDQLGGMVLWLRDSQQYAGVVLVGHSLGGVLAWEVLTSKPELSVSGEPFIRTLVTVDSPLGGVDAVEALVMRQLTSAPTCPVVDALRGRQRSGPTWQAWLGEATGAALARGVKVASVVNDQDLAVLSKLQTLPLDVNHLLSLDDSGLNHFAALQEPAGVRLIASLLANDD